MTPPLSLQTVHKLHGMKSGSLGVRYAERLLCVTIFWAETVDSVLIYICTKILTSPLGQDRKNKS